MRFKQRGNKKNEHRSQKVVRARGLEPPILSEPDPKSGASAIPPRARPGRRWSVSPQSSSGKQSRRTSGAAERQSGGAVERRSGGAAERRSPSKSHGRTRLLVYSSQG